MLATQLIYDYRVKVYEKIKTIFTINYVRAALEVDTLSISMLKMKLPSLYSTYSVSILAEYFWTEIVNFLHKIY